MKLTEAKLKQLIKEVMAEGEGLKAQQIFQTECMFLLRNTHQKNHTQSDMLMRREKAPGRISWP